MTIITENKAPSILIIEDDNQSTFALSLAPKSKSYDFTAYAKTFSNGELTGCMRLLGSPSFAVYRYRLRLDQGYFNLFIEQLIVNVTETFRIRCFIRLY
ncbi:hypothetical protein [Arachidicoccus ginsenosidivorans]